MCEWFDETCGELLEFLDRRRLADKTIVLFVVDNGWIQNLTGQPADPRRPWTRGFAPKSKLSPYDGGVRTPILVRWPGKVKSARREELVSSVDLAPTILRACGVTPPEGMHGVDLVALGNGTARPREAVFGEVFLHEAVKVADPASGLTYRWIRQGDWKLIRPLSGEPELYNLSEDPHEERNLDAAQAERASNLHRVMDEWWAPNTATQPAGPN
jgi:uncharacterized sulfatase